jgi:hypothetical protein
MAQIKRACQPICNPFLILAVDIRLFHLKKFLVYERSKKPTAVRQPTGLPGTEQAATMVLPTKAGVFLRGSASVKTIGWSENSVEAAREFPRRFRAALK